MKFGKILRSHRYFHILVVASAHCHAEHIPEPVGAFHILGIETENRLVNVPFKIRLGNEVISAEDNPLEVPPKALNAVGGEGTHGELLLAVADKHMVVAFAQSVVDGGLVGDNSTAVGDEVTDDRDNRGCLGVSNLPRHLVGVRLLPHLARLGVHIFGFPLHSHTEHGSLRLGSTLCALGFLRFVLVGFPTSKVHFVTLHNTRKDYIIILLEKGTNLMQNKPSSFLRYGDIRSQLNGGYTLLMAGDKVHCKKPFDKRNLCVFKDSTYSNGEVSLAVTAMESAISTAHAMMLPAERTNHIVLAPS